MIDTIYDPIGFDLYRWTCVLQFQDIYYTLKLKPKAEWFEMLCMTERHKEFEKTILNGITTLLHTSLLMMLIEIAA